MIVTVVYPKTATSKFDMDYYTTKHMPLVHARWSGHGMISARVLHGTGSMGGAPAFEVITIMEFPSREAFLAAAGAHADEIMGDVPHFTDIEPLLQLNEIALG